MTSFWRDSWRLRWCARICGAPPAARPPAPGTCAKKLIEALPYSLTQSQTRAVGEIVADLAKPERMLRLLQGDVGSGKTVVALLAAAAVIEGGRQAALMAPTEILARQHFNTIAPLAAAAGDQRRHPHRTRARPRTQRDPAKSSPSATSICSSAPMRCSRRTSSFATSRSPWSTSSIASACISGCARQEGRSGRRAGDDGDADPAHAGADLFRRHGCIGTARKAGRARADRYPRDPARPARRNGRCRRARACRGPPRLLGMPAGGGNREYRSRRGGRALCRAEGALRRAWSISCMAA